MSAVAIPEGYAVGPGGSSMGASRESGNGGSGSGGWRLSLGSKPKPARFSPPWSVNLAVAVLRESKGKANTKGTTEGVVFDVVENLPGKFFGTNRRVTTLRSASESDASQWMADLAELCPMQYRQGSAGVQHG